MNRIVIVGTSGSGKTTLARRLALRLDCPHVELDALHWGPNWSEAETDEFRDRVLRALAGDRWVVDGNYGKVRDLVWQRADTIVWLDFSLPRTLWQVTRRTLRRLRTREELWSGNRENWRMTLFSRESILLWSLQTHGKNRRRYSTLFASPRHDHLERIVLRSPRATELWLDNATKMATSASRE